MDQSDSLRRACYRYRGSIGTGGIPADLLAGGAGPRTVGGGWFYDSPLFDAGGEMTIYGEMYREQ